MKEMLREFLNAQRGVVLAILDDTLLTTAALPSGWTPVAMVEHLGYAERYWFEEIMTGVAAPLPWDEDPPPMTTPRSPAVLIYGSA